MSVPDEVYHRNAL